MNFTNYFVFMFLALSLIAVFGTFTYNLISNYDVELSEDFDNYMNSINSEQFANEDVLTVEAEDSQAGGEFAAYSSSFKFFDQVKTTMSSTNQFIQSSGQILGLPPLFWIIIGGVVGIIVLILGIYFLRGLNER